MSRAGERRLVLVLALLWSAWGFMPAQEMEESRAPGTARVIQFNRSLLYIDAGREDGLREGDSIEVLHDGEVVATLRVTYLASHRASCSLDEEATPAFQVGDTVRFSPHLEEAPAAVATPQRRKHSGESALRRAGMRGRIGIRYLLIRDSFEDGSSTLNQPGLDLRLSGTNIAGSNVGLWVDVRGQRTYSAYGDGTDTQRDRNRVHQLWVSWLEPNSGLSVQLGRQYSPTLSSVSLFDGILVDFGRPRWNIGAFSGAEPDPIDLSFSTDVRQHGLYVSTHNRPGASKLWGVTVGGVGTYAEGEIDREFVFFQTRYGGPRISLYLAQEVDYNRGWKTEFEESTFAPTSTFFNFQVRATRGLRFTASYDDRRRVRLYRDRITPETEFDDANRQGARLGWTWSNRHYRVGMDGSSTTGETIGDGESYSLYFGAVAFTSQQVGVTTRATVYSNERAEGTLYALTVGTNLGSRVRLQAGGGRRDELLIGDPRAETGVTWVELDLDFNLGRHWYLLLSGEQNRSDTDDNLQLYTSVTYRF